MEEKISTAEIKRLIKSYVREGKYYTSADFMDYVRSKSGKRFTRGQMSGAVAQLIDAGNIVRIERGLYIKGEKADERVGSGGNTKDNTFKSNIRTALGEIQDILSKVTSVQPLDLSEEEFRILSDIRAEKENLEKIEEKCK